VAGAQFAQFPSHVSFLIRQMTTHPPDGVSAVLDPTKVGIAAHSLGADIMLRVGYNQCCIDSRVRAAAILAGVEATVTARTAYHLQQDVAASNGLGQLRLHSRRHAASDRPRRHLVPYSSLTLLPIARSVAGWDRASDSNAPARMVPDRVVARGPKTAVEGSARDRPECSERPPARPGH
jgi:hypothetical protein